jgi:hypothetical protein
MRMMSSRSGLARSALGSGGLNFPGLMGRAGRVCGQKQKILELILNECQLFGIYMCDMPEYNYLATTVFAKRRSRP